MHIVVTGASSGIGRAICVELDAPGHRMSLVARRRGLLEELGGQLAAETQAIAADLSDPADPIAWLRSAEQRFGPVDLLVNNAGISYVEPTRDIEEERVRRIFQVNVHVPIAAVQHVLPAMLDRAAGTIVNVASNAAFSPAPGFSHYTASKGALGNFSESLRMELLGSGVVVVTVYPGPVETPMGDRNWRQLEASRAARLAPIGDAAALANLVRVAVEQRRARVIYPRVYTLGWWFPSIGRWMAERFVPRPTGERTPPLPGDLEEGG